MGAQEKVQLKFWALELKSEEYWENTGMGEAHSVLVAHHAEMSLVQDEPGEAANHAWPCNLCEEIWALS